MSSDVLLAATTNQGKLREMQAFLAGIPGLRVLSLNDLPDVADLDVPETGATFAANAMIKAHAYAEFTGFSTLAEDSGLEIAALGGFPGVHTARWLGESATQEEKNTGVLARLKGVSNRRARFVTALAYVDRLNQVTADFEGVCTGTIALEPHGSNGFGYDSIFIPDAGDGLTFGQLSPEFKAAHSHRAKAFAQFRAWLIDP